jgi:glycosyltransferase involved in cell wall biosynthesis
MDEIQENRISMRLLQITASNVWRGHEQQIVYYYDEFAGKIEHQVLLCTPGTRLAEIAEEKKYNYHTLPFTSEYDIKWMRKIRQIVKEDKIDIILIHNSTAHTLCVISSLLFGLNTSMVFFRTLIKRVDTNFFRKWKYNYKHLKKIVCVSDAVRESLLPAIKDHSRLCIVGSATNLDEFSIRSKRGILQKELGIDNNTKIIANISAFVGFKDHVTFINTAAILKHSLQDVKFVLIGKGELEDEIKEMATAKGLANDVVFMGFRTDIPEIFPDFDIFLFTSKLEPTGGVLLEAYASHVPVVAAKAGGVPEVVIDGKTGILCEKENAQAFADAVMQLVNNPAIKERMINDGYKYLVENFTKEVIAEKMLNELKNVYIGKK